MKRFGQRLVLSRRGHVGSTNTFFIFLGISGGGLAIVFCTWNFMIDLIWNNFSHRKRNLKSCCPPPLKFFFSTAEPLFEKDRWALEPTANMKILYTTLEKPFLRQRDKRADRTLLRTRLLSSKWNMRQPGKRTGVEDEGGGSGIVQENVAAITAQLSLCLYIVPIWRVREIKI
jgi:hypothetical protein